MVGILSRFLLGFGLFSGAKLLLVSGRVSPHLQVVFGPTENVFSRSNLGTTKLWMDGNVDFPANNQAFPYHPWDWSSFYIQEWLILMSNGGNWYTIHGHGLRGHMNRFSEQDKCDSQTIWAFPKMVGFPPKIIHFNRVFHYFHHPFRGPTPIFGSTPI